MSHTKPPTAIGAVPPTLASASLPARVRQILQGLNTLAGSSLEAGLKATLTGLEHELFRLAEQSRSNQQQADWLAQLKLLEQHGHALTPRFLVGVEAALASLRDPPTPEAAEPANALDPLEYRSLTLVENTDLDRDIVLREIARRESRRGGTALLLLGQRFGVLAARPAFDAFTLPLGPQALCRIMRDAGQTLHLSLDAQLQLYRAFEQHVMERHGELVERMNVHLAHEGVLPGLVYLPYHPRPQQQGRPRAPLIGSAGAASQKPSTGWQGQERRSAWSGALLNGLAVSRQAQPSADAAADALPEQAVFSALRELLSEHRGQTEAKGSAPASGLTMPLNTVMDALGALQSMPPARTPGRGHRTMDELREGLVERMRRAHGPKAGLSPEHADTFDLLGMLYHEIDREVRQNTPARDLLERLQVPIARAAVQDRSFFVRDQHPARELLNAVAESGATWLADEDADPQLVLKLEQAVGRVVDEYDGDETVFERASQEVQEHHRAQARKAEVSERRQVEAARGRDRLETAKQNAARAIARRLEGHHPPQFVQALLQQAWADVLTLTALRHGEDSPEWQEREAATARIVATTCDPVGAPDATLADQIDAALRLVGYHQDEASAIARRLSRSDEDETTSRTELTARLKARARLGDQGEPKKPVPPPRTAQEQASYEHLRTLPFGTWFEFVSNQQGDVRRQRLSWYSPITDNALFVNARGQKVGEQSLDALARLIAHGQARIVTEDKARLIDRAWQATLRALRGLAGANPQPALGAAGI